MMPRNHDSTVNADDVSFDRLFKALADKRRRRVLSYLDGKDGDVATVKELTDHVTVHEVGSVDDPAIDAVAIALYHTHLPHLEEAGLITYDERSRTVRYRENPRLEPYLQGVAERELA